MIQPLYGGAPLIQEDQRRRRKEVEPLSVMFAEKPEKSGWPKAFAIAIIVAVASMTLTAIFII